MNITFRGENNLKTITKNHEFPRNVDRTLDVKKVLKSYVNPTFPDGIM